MQEDLTRMLYELESNRLVVAKIRIERGYIRAPISWNAPWYQRLCRANMTCRKRYPKARTIIKRIHTVTALRRMLKGDLTGVYAERILAVIEG
jgi:hypothetical protein